MGGFKDEVAVKSGGRPATATLPSAQELKTSQSTEGQKSAGSTENIEEDAVDEWDAHIQARENCSAVQSAVSSSASQFVVKASKAKGAAGDGSARVGAGSKRAHAIGASDAAGKLKKVKESSVARSVEESRGRFGTCHEGFSAART